MTDLSGISSKTRRWPRRPLGRQALLGVVGLLSLFVAFALLAIALVARFNGDEKHLDTASVDYVNAVQQGALDAKGIANDQRGFLLSGEEQFLVEAEGAEMAIPVTVDADGHRQTQPVFCLMPVTALDSLIAYINGGGRKIETWAASHRLAEVPFPVADAFAIINTLDVLRTHEAR